MLKDNRRSINMKNKIFNEDCISYLKKLEDKSVDVFLLDPPYMGVVKDKWDNQWKNTPINPKK